MKELLRRLVNRLGYDLQKINILRSHKERKKKLINDLFIDLLIDGGANEGQYVEEMRDLGFTGKIISIEPLQEQFNKLKRKANLCTSWTCLNYALSDNEGCSSIFANNISQVSSLLPATGIATTTDWKTKETQAVELIKLSSIIANYAPRAERIYLKLDIQGSEKAALDGLEEYIDKIAAIELEVSTLPLYEGETLAPEMLAFLSLKGFSIFSIEPLVVDHISGKVLQIEVLVSKK
jgi:FkbM family methyltransferase